MILEVSAAVPVPGEVRDRGGIWTWQSDTRTCDLHLYHAERWEVLALLLSPACFGKPLNYHSQPHSLNFHIKGDWGENSLKPQIVLYPLICSVNFPPIAINMGCLCIFLGRRVGNFSSEVYLKASWFRKKWLKDPALRDEEGISSKPPYVQGADISTLLTRDWAPSSDWTSCTTSS